MPNAQCHFLVSSQRVEIIIINVLILFALWDVSRTRPKQAIRVSPRLIDTLGFWPTPLPPTFRNFQKCSFLLEIQIPIYVMKKRSAINSKGSDWYCRCQLQHCGP